MNQISDQRVFRALLRQDFGAFNHKVFNTLHKGASYEHNWHIDTVAHTLTQVSEGYVKRQLILQPPRSLKSITTSVAWVAWSLGHDPSKSFICISYSQDLATELAEKFRLVVESQWYKDLFPGTRFTKLTQTDAQTDKGGRRLATSIGGTLTGRGADIIIIDDPLKADEAHSETARKAVIDWYAGTLQSRLNNQKKSAIILVMQRLHEEDLAGYILGQSEDNDQIESASHWKQLCLPAIAVKDERIPIGQGRFYHRKEGEFLHAAREGRDELAHLKRELGSQRFSAQYQQNPVPLEGNLIKRDWLIPYDPNELEVLKTRPYARIVQSWDVAGSTTNASDWSVCTTWLKLKNDYYLMHVLRKRLAFPDLKRRVVSHGMAYGAQTILIEKNGLGLSLFQELQEDMTQGFPRPIGIRVKEDKLVRMEAQSAKIEAGQMHIPAEAPWLGDYMHELLAFPYGKFDDQVDSTSQFLKWASDGMDFIPPAGVILIHG